MADKQNHLYCSGMTPEKLAEKVLEDKYGVAYLYYDFIFIF